MIRTFIALPVGMTAELQRTLRWLKSVGRPIRAVESEELHITLQFLGETAWEKVPEIDHALAECTRQFREIPVTLGPLSGFPNLQRPRVIFAEIHPKEPVIALHEDLSVRLEAVGLRLEHRPFVPHLTLARVKGDRDLAFEELQQGKLPKGFGDVLLDTLVHYESHFESRHERKGSMYEVLSEHYLQ